MQIYLDFVLQSCDFLFIGVPDER